MEKVEDKSVVRPIRNPKEKKTFLVKDTDGAIVTDTGLLREAVTSLLDSLSEFERKKLLNPDIFNISLLICLADTQIKYQEVVETFRSFFTKKNLKSYFEYRVIGPNTKKEHQLILEESLKKSVDILFIIGNLQTPLSISCGVKKQGTHTIILPLDLLKINNFLEEQLSGVLSINVQDDTFELQF